MLIYRITTGFVTDGAIYPLNTNLLPFGSADEIPRYAALLNPDEDLLAFDGDEVDATFTFGNQSYTTFKLVGYSHSIQA